MANNYGNVPPDLETLAEASGARDYLPCGHRESSRKPDGSCRACFYEASIRERHCEQARAGYFYCRDMPGDPCGPGPYPHDGHVAGQCANAS
jgi:hypothetical protein